MKFDGLFSAKHIIFQKLELLKRILGPSMEKCVQTDLQFKSGCCHIFLYLLQANYDQMLLPWSLIAKG